MIFINEWLPNPAGNDAAGEWIELFNGGKSAVSLNGWSFKTSGGKSFKLGDVAMRANEYLILPRTATKLVLKNTDEKIFLYDGAGKLVDQSGFLGSAPEGKSFSRISLVGVPGKIPNFIFSEPTPGQPNATVKDQNFLMNNEYPSGQPLNNSLGYFDVLALTASSAFLLAFFITILFKRNDYLSKLFFGKD